jgi:hypothetical protein
MVAAVGRLSPVELDQFAGGPICNDASVRAETHLKASA